MRVAVVTESFLPSVNGVTNSVLRVLDTLADVGHEAIVIAPTSDRAHYRGFPVVTTPRLPIAGFPVALPAPIVAQTIDAFAPHVVHVASPFWLGGVAIAHAEKRQIPTVAIYQTDVAGYMTRYGFDFAGPWFDAITAAIHRLATITLAPTPDSVDYLSTLGVRNVEQWGRGVDTELFTPQRKSTPAVTGLRKRLAPNGETIVGYVGRLAPEKQVGRLREICDHANTTLLIVGDGPLRTELEDHFAGCPVTFTGRLGGEELANAYAAMDVFVHCGTEETFGQTIQEAHAAGVPVIAPNRGGQRHLIRHGIDGYLVDHSRDGAFRDAVAECVSSPDIMELLCTQARASVEGKTWAKNNEALLSVYSRVAGSSVTLPAAA